MFIIWIYYHQSIQNQCFSGQGKKILIFFVGRILKNSLKWFYRLRPIFDIDANSSVGVVSIGIDEDVFRGGSLVDNQCWRTAVKALGLWVKVIYLRWVALCGVWGCKEEQEGDGLKRGHGFLLEFTIKIYKKAKIK